MVEVNLKYVSRLFLYIMIVFGCGIWLFELVFTFENFAKCLVIVACIFLIEIVTSDHND